MRHIFAVMLIALFLFYPSHGFAQVKEIISEGAYNMGDGETPTVAESRALLNAKRVALEQAGTYVESYTKVENMQVTEDEIQVLASGIMEVEILDKKRTVVGDGFRFWVKIKARVNPDNIKAMANKVKDKSVVDDYKKIQEAYDKSQKEIGELKKQLAQAKGEKEKKQVEAKISDDERMFQANEWFEKGYRHTVNSENDIAIEEYTNAIALNPDYAEAYNNRGISYYNRGLYTSDQSQFESAIKDFNKVVVLKPGSYSAYFAQAAIYIYKEQYDKAIEELNKAIVLNPDDGVAYVGRGFVYRKKERIDKALEDYNKVIKMGGLWSAMAYFNRGGVYFTKEKYDLAVEDFSISIELGPRNAQAYLGRGLASAFKKQYNRAIEDINKSIELGPNNSNAYVARGAVYAEIGNPRAISDFQKACDMGNEKGCKYLQKVLEKR